VRSPRACRAFHAASTSCQSNAANRKAGDTGRSRAPARSVCASREGHEALPERLLENDVEQRQDALVQPDLAQLAQAGAGVPESSSFSISSNKRAGGTRSMSGAISRIGSRVAGSSVRPSFAASPRPAACVSDLPVPGFRIADHAAARAFSDRPAP